MELGLLGIQLKKLKMKILIKEIANLVPKSQTSMKIQETHRILNLTLKRNLEIQRTKTVNKN